MSEVVAIGTEYPKALVGITDGEGNGPGHAGFLLDGLIGIPAYAVGGIADAKYRVEQQVDLAGAGADDKVCARYRIGKAPAGLGGNPVHPEKQGDADGHGQQGEPGGETTSPETLQGKFQHDSLRFCCC